jgi:hypothetical protein
MTNEYSNRVFETARFGAYIPNDPMLEARSGGTNYAGIRDIARNTLRSTWEVLSLVLRNDRPDAY